MQLVNWEDCLKTSEPFLVYCRSRPTLEKRIPFSCESCPPHISKSAGSKTSIPSSSLVSTQVPVYNVRVYAETLFFPSDIPGPKTSACPGTPNQPIKFGRWAGRKGSRSREFTLSVSVRPSVCIFPLLLLVYFLSLWFFSTVQCKKVSLIQIQDDAALKFCDPCGVGNLCKFGVVFFKGIFGSDRQKISDFFARRGRIN